MKTTRTLPLIATLALAWTLSACAGARPKTVPKPVGISTATAFIPPVDAIEASLRGEQFQSVEGLHGIYFEYDSSALSDEALSTLKVNASFLKKHPDLEVLTAGFCDERGTVEYNLALGQKRAKEVREYYIHLGIPGPSMATISYGKEQPVCTQPAEECWSKNRRADTRARSRQTAEDPPPPAAL